MCRILAAPRPVAPLLLLRLYKQTVAGAAAAGSGGGGGRLSEQSVPLLMLLMLLRVTGGSRCSNTCKHEEIPHMHAHL